MEAITGMQFIVMLILVMIPVIFVHGVVAIIEVMILLSDGESGNTTAWDQYHYTEMIPHRISSISTEIILSCIGGFALMEFYLDYLHKVFPMHMSIIAFLIFVGIVLGVHREWLAHRTPDEFRELLEQQWEIHNCSGDVVEEEDESDE